MSNCVFGFPIYSDPGPLFTPTFGSAGSWLAALPRTNVQDRRLHRVARSTDATATSTQITLDLGVARTIGLFAVLLPNLTKTATPVVRFIGGTVIGASNSYDSGNLQAWPTGVTAEDVTGPDGSPMNVWQVVTPTPFSSRFPSVLISDTGNVDGYLDVARVIIAGALSPAVNTNMSDGAKDQFLDDTVIEKTEGGAALYQAKRGQRSDSFSIDDVIASDAAAFRQMHRRLGKSGQVFWVPDPSDSTYGWQRNYLGVLRELGAMTANNGRTNGEYAVLEEL